MDSATRVKISKQIVMIPEKNAQAEQLKQLALAGVADAQATDLANAGLYLPYQEPINKYQLEFDRIDGKSRGIVDEQKVQDAGDKKTGNIFFPVFETGYTPLPAWGQAWTSMFPCLMAGAVGKKNDQTYAAMPVTGNEKDLITEFNAKVAILEGVSFPVERCTGKKWDNTTPPGVMVDYVEIQTAMTELVTCVTNLKAVLNSHLADMYVTDSDLVRQAETIAAKNTIPAVISAIDTWLAYPNFSTFNPPPAPTTKTAFESFNINLFVDPNKSKGHPDYLNAIKSIISGRNLIQTVLGLDN